MKVTVVKIGGNQLSSPGYLPQVAEAIAALATSSKVVLVHGGGREVDRWLARLGLTPQYHQGQRVTDQPSLEVVEAVLAGTVNKAIVRALLEVGVKALGVCGNDLAILPVDPWEGLGRVGRAERASREPLELLLGVCDVLVVAPLGLGREDGLAYNVNADHAAAAIAVALKAPLALVSDVPGVLVAGELVPSLDATEARRLIDTGVVSGGMVPKVEAAFAALDRGASAAIVVDLAGLRDGGTVIVQGIVAETGAGGAV